MAGLGSKSSCAAVVIGGTTRACRNRGGLRPLGHESCNFPCLLRHASQLNAAGRMLSE